MNQDPKLYPTQKRLGFLLLLLISGQLELMGTVLGTIQKTVQEHGLELLDHQPELSGLQLNIPLHDLATVTQPASGAHSFNSFSVILRCYQQQVVSILRVQTRQFQHQQFPQLIWHALIRMFNIDRPETLENAFLSFSDFFFKIRSMGPSI